MELYSRSKSENLKLFFNYSQKSTCTKIKDVRAKLKNIQKRYKKEENKKNNNSKNINL